MKIEKNSLNALSTDRLLLKIRSKMSQTLFLKCALTSNANYYFIADIKED